MAELKALIFDCDGVLVDTEKDGHRVAFNRAFAQKGYDFEWDVPLYGELLKVAGGKERMRAYFDQYGWPADTTNKDELIKELHKLKTDLFMQIIASGQLPLRPGVKRLIDEAIAEDITLAVCSTSNERAVTEQNLKLRQQRRSRGCFHLQLPAAAGRPAGATRGVNDHGSESRHQRIRPHRPPRLSGDGPQNQ